ncbi:MAG: Ig-like domain-containing protein, partial [Verrucomicrobia bacterium]|nr:Ig-like domain-containing protein [Verrucomicrobiota bacterium]
YQHFKINPSGKLLYQPVGAVTGTIAQSSGSVNNGQWRQVVAVLNSPTVQLYIDGAPDGSGTLGGSMTTLHTKLGAMQALGNPLYQPYTGLMDDVAVWNTALTAGKVRSLSTITTVLGDYSASKMDKLFQVYDGTLGSYNDGTRTWQKVTGLTEHGAGDAWTDGSTCYVQFDAAGAGVRGTSGAPVVATKLAITSVNGGVSPIAGTAFSVVVQGQDAGGTPGGVTAATAVSLSLKTGTGTLGGMLSGTIAAGASVVTISGATYSKAESGVVLTATRTSGDNLTAGDSGAFAVNSPPPPTATITLSKPTGRAIYQRNNDNLANVQIKGTYTGSADGVEARAVTRVGYGGTTTAWTAIAAAVGQFDGTLSVTGGWYDVDVRTVLGGVQTGISTVQRVGAGEVFITAGQSNSANYGSPQQSPADDRVSAYNLGTASWQLANDPQPAAGGSGGSPWPHLGDLLAARSAVPIGIVAVGVGGTKVIQWQPGTTFYDYILAAINGLKSTGGCRAILWHQGESDSNPPTGMDPNSSWDEVYATNLENVIAQSRTDAGFTVPWGVAIASWNGTGEANYAHVTNGQHLVIDHYPAVFLGSQTDIFHSDNLPYLSDGIHFNQQGLDAHGQQWADALFAANIIVGSSIVADAGTSTVVASPAMVANDGVSTSTITVTLKDANSNPVGGKSVTLASSRGACDTISAASGPSNGSGVVTFTVRSATAGLAEFTATDTTDAPGVVIATPATVTFYAVSLGHMIGHWALDETGGTTAACDVNAHYDGAIAGATIDQSGKIGKAFGFGGSGYVDVNAAPWSGTMTVSAWINTTTG